MNDLLMGIAPLIISFLAAVAAAALWWSGRAAKRATNPVYRALAAGCLFHALAVLAVWALILIGNAPIFISGQAWLIMAWLWLFWPLALCVPAPRSLRGIGVPVLIGIAMLVPCVPFVFAFTAWSIYGFAP